MIKAVIFDCGAVMHSLEGTNARGEILAFLSGKSHSKEDLEKKYIECIRKLGIGKIDEEAFWKELCDFAGVELLKDYPDFLRSKFKENARAYPEMFDLVKKIKKLGYKAFLLSNTIVPHSEVIKDNGWYDDFDRVFLSHDVGMKKPETPIYEHVLKEIGFLANEVLFVDDREENLVPARALGIKSILAVTPGQVVRDVEKALEYEGKETEGEGKADFHGAKGAVFFGKSLLVYLRDDKPGIPFSNMWDFPGGGREVKETPYECFARELKEEFSLDLARGALLWEKKYLNDDGHTVYFFIASFNNEESQKIVFGNEGQKWELMSPEDFLSREDAIPKLKERLLDYLKSKAN